MALEKHAELPGKAEKRAEVHALFERIAPRYDALNRLLTFGLDQRWRRRALSAVGVSADDRLVDLACGTGDLAELARRRGAHVIGVDLAKGMLVQAQRRGVEASFVRADGAALPLRDGCADVVSCGFALRNFVSLGEIFRELARVLAPGGRVALLEVDRPVARPVRAAHALYFDRVVPALGALLSDRSAYAYLPRSTAYLPPAAALLSDLEQAGFRNVERRSLLLGAVQLITGIRARA